MKHMTKEELIAYGETLPIGQTRDARGNKRSYKDDEFWHEITYDENGCMLTYTRSCGYFLVYERDRMGNVLSYKDSNGAWCESTYDDNGLEITYKDSEGVWRGFSNEEIKAERARLKQVRKNLKDSMK